MAEFDGKTKNAFSGQSTTGTHPKWSLSLSFKPPPICSGCPRRPSTASDMQRNVQAMRSDECLRWMIVLTNTSIPGWRRISRTGRRFSPKSKSSDRRLLSFFQPKTTVVALGPTLSQHRFQSFVHGRRNASRIHDESLSSYNSDQRQGRHQQSK